MSYLRHTLCYLNQQAQPLSCHSKEELKLLKYWLSKQFPLIVIRQPEDKVDAYLYLAIPYFDKQQSRKIRSRYLFAKSDITDHQKLPLLEDLFPHVNINADIRIYGSYCWQYLTGKTYVQANSDLDVLINYSNHSLMELTVLYHDLTHELHKIALDGEIRFPHVGECSWLELIHDKKSSTLLVKSHHQVYLIEREHLYAQFPALLS